jgi:hypothetical protein
MSDILLPSIPMSVLSFDEIMNSVLSEFQETTEFTAVDTLAHSVTNYVVNNNVELEYVYDYEDADEFQTVDQEAYEAWLDYQLDQDYDW